MRICSPAPSGQSNLIRQLPYLILARLSSVLVVVTFVGGVSVSVVDVVQMIAVEDWGVAASRAVYVGVLLGRPVLR